MLFKIGSALIANKFIAGVTKREKYSSLGTYPLGISFENMNLILKLFVEKFLRKLRLFNRTKFNFEGKNDSSFKSSNASNPNSSLFIKRSSNSSKLSLSGLNFIS